MSSFLLFPVNDADHQMFLIFMLAGLTSGGVATYSADLVCVIGFSLAALLPLLIRLFVAGNDHLPPWVWQSLYTLVS